MHTHLIAGGYYALALGLAFNALLSVAVHLSGRRNVNYLLLAAISAFSSVYALGLALHYHAATPELVVLGSRISRSVAAVGIATSLQFALRYGKIRHERLVTAGVWGLASSIALGVLFEPLSFDPRAPLVIQAFGMRAHFFWTPPGIAATLLSVLAPVIQLAACAAFATEWVRGRKEALGLTIGAAVLWLSVLNDAAVMLGYLRGIHLAPVGVLAQAFGVATYFVARYSSLTGDLTRRKREVRERMTELVQVRKDLHALQTELGRKEQLAAVGEMAAVIAHEARNPLAVISNAVASLKREGLCREDHDVLLGILEEESVRLNRLVSDLLAYARPINPQRQRVILQDLVQRAAMLVGNRGTARFEFDDSSARGQIWADGNLLRQVFDNLIENAVQAMGGAGTVTIAVKAATQEGVEGYAVSVADEGEGMDTVVRNRAKDPFFTTRPAGTGLGLAIVDRIVEAHGGHLTLESRSGEGSTVTVFLPLGSESIPPPEPRSSERPRVDSIPSPSLRPDATG